EGHRPGRDQVLDGLGVDLGGRAVTLALGAEAEADDVTGGLGVIQDVSVGDILGQGRATGKGRGDEQGKAERASLGRGMTVHGLSPCVCMGSKAWTSMAAGQGARNRSTRRPPSIP